MTKNPAAVALGKLGSKNLTKEQRKERARLAGIASGKTRAKTKKP